VERRLHWRRAMRSSTPREHPRRDRDQRGFSLVIVFLIILVMVGLAAGVMVTTQGDLQVSGSDREAKVALYAAQAGMAQAQDYLLNKANGATSWTTYLGSGDVYLCTGATSATTPPRTPTPTNVANCNFDSARGGCYQFCIHNNPTDPLYFQGGASPNINDSDNIITIEAWGTVGAAGAVAVSNAHLVADVSFASGRTPIKCYIGDQGCERKQNSNYSQAGDNVNAGSAIGVAYGN
jgi:hypothetical protein